MRRHASLLRAKGATPPSELPRLGVIGVHRRSRVYTARGVHRVRSRRRPYRGRHPRRRPIDRHHRRHRRDADPVRPHTRRRRDPRPRQRARRRRRRGRLDPDRLHPGAGRHTARVRPPRRSRGPSPDVRRRHARVRVRRHPRRTLTRSWDAARGPRASGRRRRDGVRQQPGHSHGRRPHRAAGPRHRGGRHDRVGLRRRRRRLRHAGARARRLAAALPGSGPAGAVGDVALAPPARHHAGHARRRGLAGRRAPRHHDHRGRDRAQSSARYDDVGRDARLPRRPARDRAGHRGALRAARATAERAIDGLAPAPPWRLRRRHRRQHGAPPHHDGHDVPGARPRRARVGTVDDRRRHAHGDGADERDRHDVSGRLALRSDSRALATPGRRWCSCRRLRALGAVRRCRLLRRDARRRALHRARDRRAARREQHRRHGRSAR